MTQQTYPIKCRIRAQEDGVTQVDVYDDIGDVGWEKAFDIEIPRDWPSGMYCVHLKSAAGIDNVPFFVRPAAHQKKAKIAILLPTIT